MGERCSILSDSEEVIATKSVSKIISEDNPRSLHSYHAYVISISEREVLYTDFIGDL